jgi:alpha-ribazole phosphatase CobZ
MNGGLTHARTIINHQVPRNYDCQEPDEYLTLFAKRKLNCKDPIVGLITAANICSFASTKLTLKRLSVVAIVTAGFSHAVSAEEEAVGSSSALGTINLILIIDGNPSDGCMVEVVKTATEAKADAMADLDIPSRYSNDVSTETVTDAIAVVSTGRGARFDYAGTATKLGHLVAGVVKNGIEEAVAKQERILRGRPLLHRLQERGINLHDLIETGTAIIVRPGTVSNCKARLTRELKRALTDINVEAMILAAVRLEEDGRKGLIPGLTAKRFASDPIALVADESIGIAIANYLGGTWGVYNFLRYDRMKPGIMKKLGPFMDDAIGGLVAGAMTRAMTQR